MQPVPPETRRAFMDLLVGRRTIHTFTPDEVPAEVLREAVAAARWAPNHRRTEPWRFYHLGGDTAERVVDLNTELVAEARGPEAGAAKRARWSQMPGWLVVTSRRHPDAIVDQENYAATCCAIQNLCLVLWSHGIGTKWGTGAVTRDARFADIVGFDLVLEQVVGLFWYGYPAAVPIQERLPVDEILFELP